MTLEILLSCMHQADYSIIERSQITSDVVVINQCDSIVDVEKKHISEHVLWVNTSERGLSRSRNMGIQFAKADICLLSDDDECFLDGYNSKIIQAFQELSTADVIAFKIANQPCKLKNQIQKLPYLKCLNISSWQIAFRRKSIIDHEIQFDPYMGAGTGNGAGEEVKFLLDCYRKKLNIYYVPIEIANVNHTQSTWFSGYNKTFFYERGLYTRYMLGFPLSIGYAFYYIIAKRFLYRKELSMGNALKHLIKGILKNDIQRQKNLIQDYR